jgi:hypothetical protein
MSSQESGKSDYPPGRHWGRPVRTYYDASCRAFYLAKNESAEVRLLSFKHKPIKEIYVKGEPRAGGTGKFYTPGRYIPLLEDLPRFEGRCILRHFRPEDIASPSVKHCFEIFDFRLYHVIQEEAPHYTQIKHTLCSADRGHEGECAHCKNGRPRIIGGPRVLSLTGEQKNSLLDHEAYLLQFSFVDAGVSSQRVQSIRAYCSACDETLYGKEDLLRMTPEEVIARICQEDHTCPKCGVIAKLAEDVRLNGKPAARGQLAYKNILVKKEAGPSRMSFSSDQLPFEPLAQSVRLRYPESMYYEASYRLDAWSFEVQSSPYGIDPEEFKDPERYAQVVTNSQLRDLNWVLFGQDRRRYYKNPFFS